MLEVSYDGGLPPGFLTAVGRHGVGSAEDSRWKNTIRDDKAEDGSFLRSVSADSRAEIASSLKPSLASQSGLGFFSAVTVRQCSSQKLSCAICTKTYYKHTYFRAIYYPELII